MDYIFEDCMEAISERPGLKVTLDIYDGRGWTKKKIEFLKDPENERYLGERLLKRGWIMSYKTDKEGIHITLDADPLYTPSFVERLRINVLQKIMRR